MTTSDSVIPEHTVPATPPRPGDVRVGPEPGHPGPPRRLPTVVRVLLGLPLMLAAIMAGALPTLVPGFATWFDGLPDAAAAAVITATFAITAVSAVGLVWLAMRYVDRRPFSEAGVTWNSRSLPALALGLALTVAVIVPLSLGVAAVTDLRSTEPMTDGHPLWAVLVIALAQAFLLQGFPEEVIWRGYVLQTLRTRPVVSVVISAAVFAACHLASKGGQQNALEHVLYLAVPFGFALLAGALVLRTGSLWSAVGVHGGYHVATTIAALWLGVGNGPWLWLAQGAVLAGLAAVLLRRPGSASRA